jgi:TRAP-type transport system small permease protein
MLAALHRAARLACDVLLELSKLALVAMTAVIVALVVSRYLFRYSFPWAEELTRYLLVWMVMLSAAIITRNDDHIRVEYFFDMIPPRLQALLMVVLRLLMIGVLVLLVRYGWRTAIGMQVTGAPALRVSMMWPYLAIPVGAALMLVFSLLSLVDDVRRVLGFPPLDPDRATREAERGP